MTFHFMRKELKTLNYKSYIHTHIFDCLGDVTCGSKVLSHSCLHNLKPSDSHSNTYQVTSLKSLRVQG